MVSKETFLRWLLPEYFTNFFYVIAFNCIFIMQGFFYRLPPQTPTHAN